MNHIWRLIRNGRDVVNDVVNDVVDVVVVIGVVVASCKHSRGHAISNILLIYN